MYADIIVDITHEKLDKVFQYKVPSHLEDTLKVGMEVIAPFGTGNRQIRGYVVAIKETGDYDSSKIKTIIDLSPDKEVIEGRMVALAAWMREYYGGTMIQSLKTVMPIKRKEKIKAKRQLRLIIDREEAKEKYDFFVKKNQKARARLMEALLDEAVLDYTLVSSKLNIASTVMNYFEEQQIVKIESSQVYRNPINVKKKEVKNIVFTSEQIEAINVFEDDYSRGINSTYVLHGVTGSGKTEIYIEMIKTVIASGRQAIVMIPEIALTYQTVMRFYRSFGENISIMNSRLSAGERYDQMMRAKTGEVSVMIGPRSALFTPFSNLGIIVIDEEHENTYKSEQVPRFHVRETAINRAKEENAVVVLGSATPSLESMYRVSTGEYKLLSLTKRRENQTLANVHIVDMCLELRGGNRGVVSRKLRQLMEERLDRREQIMLFLNRRGYAGFISCRSCGYVVKCKHCDVSLAVHKDGRLRCHYCGYEEGKKTTCPKCDSHHIKEFRAGTQQIESLVMQEFPDARVLRMDLDTTKSKTGHEKILSAFANEEADILIGTQMIVKGHDFPNVTLVGVLAADMSLHSGDYLGSERTFQLLTQAVGRAGRGDKKGEAVIQTYCPSHYAIVAAANQDYQEFYQREIEYRRLMGYPPVENLLAVLISCEDENHLEVGCEYLKKYADNISKNKKIKLIGPSSPGISKISDVHRKVFYLKSPSYDTLIDIKNKMEAYIEINSGFNNIKIQFDFNPMKIG